MKITQNLGKIAEMFNFKTQGEGGGALPPRPPPLATALPRSAMSCLPNFFHFFCSWLGGFSSFHGSDYHLSNFCSCCNHYQSRTDQFSAETANMASNTDCLLRYSHITILFHCTKMFESSCHFFWL